MHHLEFGLDLKATLGKLAHRLPGHEEPAPKRPQPNLCAVPEHPAKDARTPPRFSTTKIARHRATACR